MGLSFSAEAIVVCGIQVVAVNIFVRGRLIYGRFGIIVDKFSGSQVSYVPGSYRYSLFACSSAQHDVCLVQNIYAGTIRYILPYVNEKVYSSGFDFGGFALSSPPHVYISFHCFLSEHNALLGGFSHYTFYPCVRDAIPGCCIDIEPSYTYTQASKNRRCVSNLSVFIHCCSKTFSSTEIITTAREHRRSEETASD